MRLHKRRPPSLGRTRQGPLWLLDLDNTLYDASWQVMGEINRRMTHYVQEQLQLSEHEASALRQRYWIRYGATLIGLVKHHGTDAQDFLSQTHPLNELAPFIQPMRGERQRIQKLRGDRWLLTNAPRDYAEMALKQIGLHGLFSRLISIEDMRACGRLCPKPSMLLMRRMIQLSGRRPSQMILVDDHSDNLKAAHRAGIRTARIWVSPTMLSRARSSGRPLTVRRPSYVALQVNSLASLIRSQHRLTPTP